MLPIPITNVKLVAIRENHKTIRSREIGRGRAIDATSVEAANNLVLGAIRERNDVDTSI
jgi:hypothetical protein